MALAEKDRTQNSNDRRKNTLNRLPWIFKIIIKFWRVFLIIWLVGGIIGVCYASTQKATYKSHLTFALSGGNGKGTGSFINMASQFGLNFGSGKDLFSGDNIIDITKSRRILESVFLSVDTFNNKPSTLFEYYLEIKGLRNSNLKIKDIHYPVGRDNPTFSYRQDSLLYDQYLKFREKYLEVKRPNQKQSIYEINVISYDEKFTKDFTDRILKETNNFYREIKTKKAKSIVDILEARITNIKGDINLNIQQKAIVKDVNINPAFSLADVPVTKQQISIQVYSTIYGELFKNLELARFQYLNEIPLIQIIDPADYPMEKIKLSNFKGGIIFAFISILSFLFILWIERVYKLSRISI